MSLRFGKFLIVATALTAVLRGVIHPRLTNIPTFEETYEALAHMLVGFLILVPFYDREQVAGPSREYAIYGWCLALWEAGWFAWQKLHS